MADIIWLLYMNLKIMTQKDKINKNTDLNFLSPSKWNKLKFDIGTWYDAVIHTHTLKEAFQINHVKEWAHNISIV